MYLHSQCHTSTPTWASVSKDGKTLLVECSECKKEVVTLVLAQERDVNEMFHVNREARLVKTSNGEVVPEDEPLFILRARDNAAMSAITEYLSTCHTIGVPRDRISAVQGVAEQFAEWRSKNATKIPGSTHGR